MRGVGWINNASAIQKLKKSPGKVSKSATQGGIRNSGLIARVIPSGDWFKAPRLSGCVLSAVFDILEND